MIFCYVISAVMLVIGAAFFTGKAASYIKGYRDMPEDEKAKINIKPLCRNMSVLFFAAAVIFGITGYFETFRELYFKWAMLGWLVLCVLDLVFINKSKRYVKKSDSPVNRKGRGGCGRRRQSRHKTQKAKQA